MQGNADYLSVDVGTFDPEYTKVYNDFCAKLGARPTTFKVNQEYYLTPDKSEYGQFLNLYNYGYISCHRPF